MKWIVPLIITVFLLGCQTPTKKRHHIHHAAHTKPKVVKADDDAAIDAIIKSLRE